MKNTFCKIKDNDNTYILVDKNKQPLNCTKNNNECLIINYQKILDNSINYLNINEDEILEKTNIPCSYDNKGYIKDDINISQYNKSEVIDNNGKKIDYNSEDFNKFENFFPLTLANINNIKTKDGYIDKNNIKNIQDNTKKIFKLKDEITYKEELNKIEKKNIIEYNDSLKIILIILYILIAFIILFTIIYLIYAFTRKNNENT